MHIKLLPNLLFPFLLLFPPAARTSDQPDLLLLKKDPGNIDVAGWYMSEKLEMHSLYRHSNVEPLAIRPARPQVYG